MWFPGPSPGGRQCTRPTGPARRRGIPSPLCRIDTAHAARTVDVPAQRRGRSTGLVEMGGVARASRGDADGRHPLRDRLVEARHHLEGRLGRHAARGVETEADYVSAWCDDGYRTNLPLEDVTAGQAWIAHAVGGGPLEPEHGGPARLLVPHLYFWKSAKWVRGLELLIEDRPGFWEGAGYHNYGDPWKEQRYEGD